MPAASDASVHTSSMHRSVAMALAESTHHSAHRRRQGPGERHEMHHTATFHNKAGFCGNVLGHLPVPALDAPVPQMVDQLPDIEKFFGAPDSEQVIEVPKILPLDVPMRAALRVTQLAEQLVDVPTILSYSSLQRSVEQHVDIPLVVEDQVLVFKVFPHRVQQRGLSRNALSGLWSRSLTLFQVDVFLVHLLLTLQLVLKNALMILAKGFFALFPKIKKSAKLASHSGSALLPESSPSTPAAQLEVSVEWVRLRERHAGKTYF